MTNTAWNALRDGLLVELYLGNHEQVLSDSDQERCENALWDYVGGSDSNEAEGRIGNQWTPVYNRRGEREYDLRGAL